MADKKSSIKIDILNILAAIDLKQEMDLKRLSELLKGSEYRPENFDGLIYRPPRSSCLVILRRDGKAVCTNARSMEDVEKAFESFVEELKRVGVLAGKKRCPSCGALLDKEDLVCLECGYVFPSVE